MTEFSLATAATLSPPAVWRHFAALCALPRPSKGEARVREHLLTWAAARGLVAETDAVGNLLIRKPASPGCAQAPGVVLQAHLDMVCQCNADVVHDFNVDPIVPVLRDGWLVAERTTLGADNGIGVALILAALEDASLVHGPLEALLTVDEESGMGGARGLAPGWLRGTLLLNLDTEDWGQFYVGCAGGIDVSLRRVGLAEPLPEGHVGGRIVVRGLRGGHSGVDIHEGRGHAIKSLIRLVRQLERRWPLRLSALSGGTARNALPREAFADIALPAAAWGEIDAFLAAWQATFRAELAGVDDGVTLAWTPVALASVMRRADQDAWLGGLHAAPQGLRRMSVGVPGVVETSGNLGVVALTPTGGQANFMLRSLVDSATADLAEEIVSLAALAGLTAECSGAYPGWRPNPASPLLARCQARFAATFGEASSVQVIHAGLECGLIGGTYPALDMVSFGPTIRGAHAPGESVEVASVARCWQLLTAILADLAEGAADA
ncbi:aminoacyl-histidine dipeptidase [Propionivibrio dicarboxylicus]|uniref:Cytosol non-specific dipeptidase n=1 Tax=Propionivibrio dicarboxylicus TaxID=83767 RepID=A0A1G8E2T5_9RHOO|nr:aminoacyl-histidine dipeptidase [Propionivibrio dicarboxylicus]SDH64247.1 dipeptidase D [Propionivibrio dicarboxylicus]